MGYAISAFVIFFLLIGSGLLLLFYREALGQRLSAVLAPSSDPLRPARSRLRRAAESLGVVAGSIQKLVPKSGKESSIIQRRLIRAGFRSETSINVFYAAKAVVPAILCIAVAASGLYAWSPYLIFGAALVLGYLVPDFVLDARINARAAQIRIGLPDLLDLLVVCLEAGLSLDHSVLRATEELRHSFPAIADELGLVMLEVRAGRPRVDAWKGLADRTDVDAVRMLVSILVQADQFGTGISKTLRIHSDTMRTRRRQRVEELAAKTGVKLVFPLLLFIFPSVWVVVLGPAVILIQENLKL
ncbi:MAG: Flp pilus assembly protein TadB [Bryobacterales bacterium]|nr:Flp pilus assembly protein TadB [Bryobacterales bacterium]